MFAAAANIDSVCHTQLHKCEILRSSERLCVGECGSKSYLISDFKYLVNLFHLM